MEEGLKNRAYLLGMRLKNAGYIPMDIVAHLTDIGLTEEEAVNVVKKFLKIKLSGKKLKEAI